MSSSYSIVVARYNENIEWLHQVMDHCLIYNKGSPLGVTNEIPLQNVGRESHTYLHHIIQNYDTLTDIVVFTQARISDHRGSNTISYLLKMRDEAIARGKSIPSDIHHKNNYRNYWWGPLFNYDSRFNVSHTIFKTPSCYKDNKIISFQEWFERHVTTPYPDPIAIYPYGLFAIKKENILSRPKSYYESLIKQCDYHINPTEGHFFERSWYYIFETPK